MGKFNSGNYGHSIYGIRANEQFGLQNEPVTATPALQPEFALLVSERAFRAIRPDAHKGFEVLLPRRLMRMVGPPSDERYCQVGNASSDN